MEPFPNKRRFFRKIDTKHDNASWEGKDVLELTHHHQSTSFPYFTRYILPNLPLLLTISYRKSNNVQMLRMYLILQVNTDQFKIQNLVKKGVIIARGSDGV